MLAHRLTTILPAMTLAAASETTRIHRVAGLTGGRRALATTRPCRTPHDTISDAGRIGGGHVLRPGEVSLAHSGAHHSEVLHPHMFLNDPMGAWALAPAEAWLPWDGRTSQVMAGVTAATRYHRARSRCWFHPEITADSAPSTSRRKPKMRLILRKAAWAAWTSRPTRAPSAMSAARFDSTVRAVGVSRSCAMACMNACCLEPGSNGFFDCGCTEHAIAARRLAARCSAWANSAGSYSQIRR
jgi:hypothetical protein